LKVKVVGYGGWLKSQVLFYFPLAYEINRMEIERPTTRGQTERPTTRWRREDRPTTRDSIIAPSNPTDYTLQRGQRSEERPVSRRGMLSKQVKRGLIFST